MFWLTRRFCACQDNRSLRERPLCADCVEKLENRTTRKISRKLISGHLCCCIARQRHCGGPVINFRGIDMVPHVAASQAHQRLWEFSYVSPKGVFEHNWHFSDMGRCL